jgi:hypothetical protein
MKYFRFGNQPIRPGAYSDEKVAFGKPKTLKNRAREMALKLLERRRLQREADESVDTFMNRGQATTRFAYFD